ncbi:MATE family efflux transporter [Prevotella dentasini]|uniref:MATE family efflux transporter n=1 Tax=Prevotella dentasini TaxID=589537 RepID=UPI000468E328|nr:MATE family efflux transporter [Prevotella dentasini]
MNLDNRSKLIRKNILFSFLIKGWSGMVQLLLVPVTLFCLGNYENGIWMTISSILLWIDSLDIGLGNGLRNKLSEQIANGDYEKARESVSSTFAMLVCIIVPVAIVLMLLVNTADIYHLLNISSAIVPNLQEILSMCIALVCATFIFRFIGNVYLGLQLPAVNNALVVGGQTLTLIGVYLLRWQEIHSLLMVALCYTLAPLLVYLLSYPVTFGIYYPKLRPSLRYFNKHAVRELFSIGVKFFVLQIAGVVLFASSNALVSRFFSPDMVTPYQVSYRYFSMTMMLFTVIAVPFWSATTDAYTKKDFAWIKRSMHRLHLILLGIAVLLVVMVAVSRPVYRLWVGTSVEIPTTMSAAMALYIFIVICSLCYSYILNGIGTLSLQLIFTVGAAVAYFPLSWLLSRYIGITGMILALATVNLPGAVVNRLQYRKLMDGTAKGIWKN